MVSIEVVVSDGKSLLRTVQSVLRQTSSEWHLCLLWNSSDRFSRRVLEGLVELDHPKIFVSFEQESTLGMARRSLTERFGGDWTLPLVAGDALIPEAVESFLVAAVELPRSGILRARMETLGPQGSVSETALDQFEERLYTAGLTVEPRNCSKPYVVRRSAYNRTEGWWEAEAADETVLDGDLFLKIEELAEISLLDRCLGYRHRDGDVTHSSEQQEDVWRLVVDRCVRRRSVTQERASRHPPYRYRRRSVARPGIGDVECVIPFWEQNRRELPYRYRRTNDSFEVRPLLMSQENHFSQSVGGLACDRIELSCSMWGEVSGTLTATLGDGRSRPAEAQVELGNRGADAESLLLEFDRRAVASADAKLDLFFEPCQGSPGQLILHALRERSETEGRHLLMRLFRRDPGYSRRGLERCLHSLARAGFQDDCLHVIEARRSSAANRNEGVRLTSKPFICFADDDVEIDSRDVFTALLHRVSKREVGLVGPRIVGPGGLVFCADPYFGQERAPRPRGLGEEDRGQYRYSREVPWLPSTFLLCKRDVILSVGGFEEEFLGSQLEDVDFSLKARSRSFECQYVGDVSVLHWNEQRNSHSRANSKLFAERWCSRPDLFWSGEDRGSSR